MSKRMIVVMMVVGLCEVAASAEGPYDIDWTVQIGTSFLAESKSVAVDTSGNVYISGYTEGDLGATNAGGDDAFLSKFDSSGNELWTTQIGTIFGDMSNSVAVDASGNVYISGETAGDLGGTGNAGDYDAFLSKFDPDDGHELWTTQIGADSYDNSWSVAVDASGNAYVSGDTHGDLGGTGNAGSSDAFLSKFDTSGHELWTTQIGTSAVDISKSVAVDASGNVYISGYTAGDLGGTGNAGDYDAFLSKFDSDDGHELWTTQIGTSSRDMGRSVAVNASGDVYISGSTYGDLGGTGNAGEIDAFLSKFDPDDGHELWTTQIGTSSSDSSYSVVVDASGNVYISGDTAGELGGSNAGGPDAFLSKFDSAGNEVWTTQIGTGDHDYSRSVAVDASGDVYISGYTRSDLPNPGVYDAFLVKYEVPEPATLSLLALGGLAALRRRKSKIRRGGK